MLLSKGMCKICLVCDICSTLCKFLVLNIFESVLCWNTVSTTYVYRTLYLKFTLTCMGLVYQNLFHHLLQHILNFYQRINASLTHFQMLQWILHHFQVPLSVFSADSGRKRLLLSHQAELSSLLLKYLEVQTLLHHQRHAIQPSVALRRLQFLLLNVPEMKFVYILLYLYCKVIKPHWRL